MKPSTAFLSSFVLLLATVPTTVASAQVTPKGSKSLLRLKWVKGRTYNYSLAMQASFQGQEQAAQTAGITMDVLDAKNGKGTVKLRSSGEIPLLQKPMTTVIDSRGRGGLGGSMTEELIQLPEKPMAVGQSWTYSQSTTTQMGKANITYKCTFRGIQGSGAQKVANIGVALVIKGSNLSGSGTGDLTIDAEDGMIRRMTQEINMQSKTTSSKGKTTTMNIPIKLVLQRQ